MLQVAQFVPATDAEGPGRRAALWLQGCPMRCVGCCNPEMLPFVGGKSHSVAEVTSWIAEAQLMHEIEGVSLLGGEPFAQPVAAAKLAAEIQNLGLTLMIYSGYRLAEIQAQAKHNDGVQSLLDHTDLLVDGQYEQDKPEPTRRWIGSTNQQIHFLTDRYSPDDARWQQPNTLEIRLVDGELSVNGFPGVTAKPLWKRPRSQTKSKPQAKTQPTIASKPSEADS